MKTLKTCLALTMILLAFHNSRSLKTQGHAESEKICSKVIQMHRFKFPNAPFWLKVLCNDCITCQLNQKQTAEKKQKQTKQKQTAEKQDFKGESLYFNNRISIDTKGAISPSSEEKNYNQSEKDHFKLLTSPLM